MPEPQPSPTPVLNGHEVVNALGQAFGHAAIDWWYVWLLMAVVAIGLAMLNGWARRIEERRRGGNGSSRRR